ncbi:MAG: hypothetical protein FWC26_03395, partial [Fibromonadales bacterium]|nr:hypothetical protein [Fibromonadales bacterium]
DVLKVFLKEHEREVYNMILGEWSMDEALEVRAEEAEARGIAIGEARGVAIGEARGVAIGEARGEARVARQMKAKGFNIAVISEMTGLSDEEIGRL